VLNTEGSDLDELDTVVEYIRKLRRVDKVHLVSWSQGSFRIGPYAIRHPDKVASLFLLSPIFNTAFQPTNAPTGLPRGGTPMTLRTRADLLSSPPGLSWNDEIKCAGQREAGIPDAAWAAIMENDEVGRKWGPPRTDAAPRSPPEGVMRVREVTLWGWNAEVAGPRLDGSGGLRVPTLIMQGESDLGQGGRQDLPALYGLVQNPNKLRFRVQCTGHFMQWENRRRLLHRVSREWIEHGKVAGFSQGEFYIDTAGHFSPLQR
jgi:pimeloyl-ACP methyl ester carboxylesterase